MLKKLFVPFNNYGKDRKIRIFSILLIPIIIWTVLPNHLFPSIGSILGSFPELIKENNLIGNFATSIWFCIKCIFYSSIIAFLFMCIARVPVFEAFAEFCRKFRFLPSAGLSLLFAKLTNSVDEQMTWIMVWGITTFLVDASIAIALSITKDEIDYAKSLRLNNWEIFREVVIYSKLPYFFSSIIQNFAIAWMLLATVENMFKSGGGIGVVLAESAKYFKLEKLYAVQIVILTTGILMDFLLNTMHNILFPQIKLNKI